MRKTQWRRSPATSGLVLALAALLALAVAGTAGARSTASATTVHVTATDFAYKLTSKTVKPGRVTFVIRNASPALHDFEIGGHRSKTIGPGKTTSLTVTLKPGRYLYQCTVDSHAELGMKGFLRVRG